MKEPKFKINQLVSHNSHTYYVHGVKVATQCYPEIQYEYFLGDQVATTSVTNESPYIVAEKEIITVEQSCELDLKEISHFYGGWGELRKVIERLEENDNEAAFERSQTDY